MDDQVVNTASVSPDQPGVTLTTEPAGESKPVRQRRQRTVTVPQELIVAEPQGREREPADTPTSLVRIAVEQGLDIDRLEKLLAMQREWEAGEARKAFFDALSKFQSELPPIVKNKRADQGKGGVRYYAPIGEINEAIRPYLYANGLSFRFRHHQGPDGITVTCIVSHRDGHSEETTLTAGADPSGCKTAIQSVASTVTYLSRYTLIAALGITTVDSDDDGEGTEELTPEQRRQNALDLARAAAAAQQPVTEAPREPEGKAPVAEAGQATTVAPPVASPASPASPSPARITEPQAKEMMGLFRQLFASGAEAQVWLLENGGTNNPSMLTETEAMGVLSKLYGLKAQRDMPPPPSVPPAPETDGRATAEQRQTIREMTTELFGDRAAEEQGAWLRSLGYQSAQSLTTLQAQERIVFLQGIVKTKGQPAPKPADEIPF